MKLILRSLGLLITVVVLAGVNSVGKAVATNPRPEEQKLRELPEFISVLMDDCGGTAHSTAKRKVLSEQIERAANKFLTGTDRHAFVALLCLETRMGTIKKTSSAGAKGVAQLMFETAQQEAKRCGIGEIKQDDLLDSETNLQVAACHYAALVAEHGSEFAPIAYNAGGNSEALKLAKKLMPSRNTETMGYATIHSIILAKFLKVP